MDKESYIYLYRDTSQRRGRLEIANHAGTPNQDAFTGCEYCASQPTVSLLTREDLDNAKISQSHRQPALVTIVADGMKSNAATGAQTSEWRLPSTDPRDEGKYLFRLHTLDIYFWTKEDAYQFVQSAMQTVHKEQMNIDYPPTVPHAEVVSPVVQQLENVAISDPAYHNGQTPSSRTATTKSPSTAPIQEEKKDPTAYTPLAYNPAAPPAPEKHAHREKTPPPPGDVPGTGLAAAAYNDHIQGQQHTPASFLPPPPGQPSHAPTPQAYSGAPPSASHSSYNSPAQSHGLSSPPMQPTPITSPLHGYVPRPSDPNAHLYSKQPLQSPTAEILGASPVGSPAHPLQHLQPQYPDYLASHPQSQQQPVGGYSNYNYTQAPSSPPPQNGNHYGTGDHSIHSQVYRPTEDEYKKHSKPPAAGPGQQPGKWEVKAEKAEKGLNRLLRKVEKKIG